MQRASILLVLLLAACDSGTPPPVEPTAPVGSSAAPVAHAPPAASVGIPLARLTELAGEYRVSALDGEDFNEAYGMALSIAGPTMAFEPVCAGFVWQVALKDGALTTTRVMRGEEAPGQGPAPPCTIAIQPHQQQLGEILDAASSATRLPSNGILLAGGGRSVLLFSQ